MRKNTVLHIFSILALVMSLVFVSSGQSFAAIEVNMAAIQADIAAAIAKGVDAKIAAKDAISKAAEKAFNDAKAKDPNFEASLEKVVIDIVTAFGSLDIAGLDPLEVFAAAREGVMAAAGLENAQIVEQGVEKAIPAVQAIVSERVGHSVDFTPVLEAYEEPEKTVPKEEAYEEEGPTVTELIQGATAEPPIVDTKPASSI